MNILHEPDARRFSHTADDITCVLDYSCRDNFMTIEHTRVPPALGGRGIAAELTRAAFDHARAHNLKIIPACSYAAVWAKRHPEVADLIA